MSTDSTAAVKKDDTIEVPKFDGVTRTVNWSQGVMSTDKSATYVVLEFSVKKKGSTGAAPTGTDQVGGMLFVEKSKLETFKSKAISGSPNTFIVTTEFEYGQKGKDGTDRWLVYHDKSYQMFQHRFFDKWNFTSSAEATQLARKFKFDSVLAGAENLKFLVGNKLREF